MIENKQLINANVEVMDAEICARCGLMELTSYVTDLYAGGQVAATCKVYRCENKRRCEYLRRLFASKTPPKVEEAESDP